MDRPGISHPLLAIVTHKHTGRDRSTTSTLRTHNRMRKAALEFNRIHTVRILTGKPPTTAIEIQHQLAL